MSATETLLDSTFDFEPNDYSLIECYSHTDIGIFEMSKYAVIFFVIIINKLCLDLKERYVLQ